MSGKKETLLELLDPPFPLVYKGILPDNPHFQMTKSRLSRECAVCERVFSVFFWRHNGIPYRTHICQICAKAANVCQVSLLDLDIGVPVIVRNKLLKMQSADYAGKSRRWYNNRVVEKMIEKGEDWVDSSIRERVLRLDPTIVKLAQQYVAADPYLSFRKAQVCQDWLSGNCIYGDSCFYSHALPAPGEVSPNSTKHGVRGRYLGTLDPNGQMVIDKMTAAHPTVFKKAGNDEEEVKEEKKIEKVFKPEGKIQEKKSVMTLPAELDEIYSYTEPLDYPFIDGETPEFPQFVGGRFVH